MKALGPARGYSDETASSPNVKFTSQKVQKAKAGKKRRQHRAQVHGVAASSRADFRGGIVASSSVSASSWVSAGRENLVRSAYLAALGMAMAGWMWMLFEGLEWVLGA